MQERGFDDQKKKGSNVRMLLKKWPTMFSVPLPQVLDFYIYPYSILITLKNSL